ncbi:hydroxymethylglutaryl-CoA lyase [Fusibacter ferrireducens]|uniref:Hydroxymethylglutaryl-CoA lyase n=1 Tax=Fusibacter ferrireducens TaxID=2785058 RepID=A0ABS0A1Q4_9FIRM|nr:hydroxymethylglutaryl-CoA lyase [Fusibacter ferrireducens]MBF4695794.1 hydroxymethylglutaryl-CoA lyase [Fusibacter ferrireducens]
MKYPENVIICEVGPRDGLQNENKILTAAEKAGLIDQVIEAGYKVIEVGSMVHPKAIPALADTTEVYKLIKHKEGVDLRVLVPNLKGAERAIEVGIKKVKLTVSASKSHNMSNFNRLPLETMDSFKASYDLVKANGLEVSGAIATSFGCPFEGNITIDQIEPIVEKFVSLGILEISLSDTTGMGGPKEVYEKCKYFKDKYPEVTWNIHFHNTRGMALANILAAMEAGMNRFDGSFGGLGGCPYAPGASGNVASEDIVHMLQLMGIETGIDLDKSIEVARNVQSLVGHEVDSYMLKAGKSSDLIREKPAKQNNN